MHIRKDPTVDQRRFDVLTRALAAPRTRRGFLGSLAALTAGLAVGRPTDAQVTQAQCGNKVCAANPGVCAPGCVCCVFGNGNSRCVPPGTCTGTVATPTPTTTPAPTATTTTAAPTTTPPPTPTTTTTRAPAQGTCAAGADACASPGGNCNFTSGCACAQTTAGETVCRGTFACAACATDADCAPVTGVGSFCVNAAGAGCSCASTGTACAQRCPIGF